MTSTRSPARFRPLRVALVALAAVVALLALLAFTVSFDYGYVPPLDKVVNQDRLPSPAYDVWGRSVSHEEAEALMRTDEGRAMLSPENWAVRIDAELLELGREVFYAETFGNELFITDVLGTLDGAITPWNVARAVMALRGQGTDNLRVRLAEDVTVGDTTFRKGDYVDTGLDVARGSLAVLGMKMRYEKGRIMAGITCALCHAAVDSESGDVLEGVTNADVNMGLLLAMGSNPGAYFARTDIDLNEHPDLFDDPSRTVTLSDGREERLPNPERLSDMAREVFMRWPPGSFDTMLDGEAGPTRTPDAFTFNDHPYGWSGFSAIGPFRGLNTLGNNVHAFNTDLLIETHMAPVALGLDPEVYLGTLLQNAARERFRYPAGSGEAVEAFYRRVDPRPDSPGLAHTQALPTYPHASALAPHGVVVSRHGAPIWHHLNALSAFQNTLKPPMPPIEPDPAMLVRGREVFAAAGCVECHAGEAFTRNEILPASRVGTEPMRATALQGTRDIMRPPQIYSMDAIVPVPEDTPAVDVPYAHLASDESIARSMGHDGEGGYKTKGLIGLYWNAPYLHAGDVAVGPDREVDLGVPGTLGRGVRPDAANSLLALVDRELRERVIEANRAGPAWALQVQGVGHEFWADEAAGFDAADQRALIHYLMLLGHHPEARSPTEAEARAVVIP